jgi:O-antigen/teichoic acid export membrane protein
MSLTDRTMSAAAWTFSSVIIQGVLQIVITSILAHFIPPEEFGLFAIASLVNVFVGLFGANWDNDSCTT